MDKFGGTFMAKDNYQISKESLNKLLYHAGEMFEIGVFMTEEYKDKCGDSFRAEVLSDGAWWRLDKNYKDIYRLVNVICNDDKLDGEL